MFWQNEQDKSLTIQYKDITIPYELVKSNRRTYAVEIKAGGQVLVRTPIRPSEVFLRKFFAEKETWIKTKYREQCAASSEGQKSGYTPQQEKALAERYRTAAKEYIPKRVEYYIQFTGGSYERIIIREQKTRWGSCSSRGTLSFNWRLMLAPPKVLDYVVVHELCHLTHMNHARDFWDAVAAVMPDYKEARKWLKENGSQLQYQYRT